MRHASPPSARHAAAHGSVRCAVLSRNIESPHRGRRRHNCVRDSGFRVDALEPRTLLAFAPVGPEFQVNTFTDGSQEWLSMASDPDGDVVVAWQSFGQDNSGWGVYARRYSASGEAQGGEFRVNTFTGGDQSAPGVASDANGNFVIAWQSAGQDGSGLGVYAQRFSADGEAQGAEFQVNSFTVGDQYTTPRSVASDADGDFVVAWTSYGQDGSGSGVYAKRYSAAGEAQGEEFQVNTFTADNQARPSVASDDKGDFVVAWQSVGQDGSGSGVYAQRYSAAVEAQGGEFQVNTFIADAQAWVSVAEDAEGDFVVVWSSYGQDGSGWGVYAQRYSAGGEAQGGEFQVNTFTASAEYTTPASVASDAAGNFIVAWHSAEQDGSDWAVYAQRYSAAGEAQDGEFQVNTFITGDQSEPSVAWGANGDFVIAWHSSPQDGSGYGIFAQRYQSAPAPSLPQVTQVFVNGLGLTGQTTANGVAFRTLARIDDTFGYAVPAGANQSKSIPWNGGVDRIALRFSADVAREVQEADLVVRGVNTDSYASAGFSYDPTTKTAVWMFSAPITNDKLRLFLDDALVGGLDGEWADGADAFPSGDGTAGGDFDFRFNVLRGDATQDGRVNALDLSFVRSKLNKTATNPGTGTTAYSPFADINPDGQINALDLSAVRARLNNGLPVGDSATAWLFTSKPVS
jgi:hypothetical protein